MKYVQLLMVLMLLPVAFAGTITLDTFEDLSIDEDSELTYTIVFTSDEGAPLYGISVDAITCAECSAPSLVAGDFTDNGDGTVDLLWTPNNDDVGVYVVDMTFEDGVDTISDSFTITVSNINDAPTFDSISSTSETVSEDDVMATVSFVVLDVDAGDVITLSYAFDVEPTTAPVFTDNGDGTGHIDFSPVNADVGTYEVTITGTDVAGESVSEVLRIEVVNVEDAPVINTVDNQEVSANIEAGDYETLEITFSASDEDIDAGIETALSYSVSHAFAGSSSVVDNMWTFTPVEADVGATETVVVTVTDEAGLTDSTTFDVTVAQNFMPVFDEDVDTLEATIAQDETITINYRVSDADGDTLTVSVSETFAAQYTVGESTLADATITDSGMTWTPGALDVGVHTFTIIASDGSYETESSEVVITVTDVDDNLVLSDVDDVDAEVGDDLEIEIDIYDPEDSEITVTVWDIDCDDSGCDSTLDVDLEDALDDFLDETSTGFNLVWEPETQDVGTHEIRIVFEDDNENAVTLRFEIEVDEVSTEYDDEIADLEEEYDDLQDDFRSLENDYCDAEEDNDNDELDEIIGDLDTLDDDLVDLDDDLDDLQAEIDGDDDLDENIIDDLLDDLENLEDDIADLRDDINDVIDDGAYCVSTYSTYTPSSDSTPATTYTSTTTTASSDVEEDDDRTVTVTTIPASTTPVASTSTEQNFGDLRIIMYMSAALVIIFAMLLFMIALLFGGSKRK